MMIRPYQEKDQAELMAFFASVFSELGHTFDLNTKDRDLAELMTHYFSESSTFLVAILKGQIIGTIGIRKFQGFTYELKRFYVQAEL